MRDREFLMWVHERMTEVHKENPQISYMHKLRAIIRDTPEGRVSANTRTGNNLADLLEFINE